MVLPVALIAAIKKRASSRGQSVTAYISALVQQDLSTAADGLWDQGSVGLAERLQQLEQRVATLERPHLPAHLQQM